MIEEQVSFEGSNGNQISGRLVRPVGSPRGYAVFAHCFACGKDLFAVREVTKSLTREGFAVLQFDFAGVGESEGDFANTSIVSNVEDIQAAGRFLDDAHEPPQLLIGHSFGGVASLMAAPELEPVNAVTTIASPYDPDHLETHFPDAFEDARETGTATIEIAGSTFTLSRSFLNAISEVKTENVLDRLDASLLILHSPQDQIVEIDNGYRLFSSASEPKSFVTLSGAGHLLPSRSDASYAASTIASWATPYLEHSDAEEEKDESGGTVQVRTGTHHYYTQISARDHTVVADEPRSAGGEDQGPTPYEYLLAALGSCTGITLRMYADRKEWDVEEIQVNLSHDKIHASDCENCEEEEGQIDFLAKEITIEGNVTTEQRERLLEIADRCPVQKTLTSPIHVETSSG